MALDHESLWQKSKVLIDRALAARDQQKDEDGLLWTALALEMLGKARLAKLHPALVADPQHAESLLAVCGGPPATEFRSILAKTAFSRCRKTVPGFDQGCEEFCVRLTEDRNAHLHSGAIPFASKRPDVWQSRCWLIIELLVVAQGRTLEEFVGADEASAARSVIADAKQTREVLVRRRIASHADGFKKLSTEEKFLRASAAKLLQGQLEQDAETYRVPHTCPACGNPGALNGVVIAEGEGEPVEESPWIQWVDCTVEAEEFRCASCSLKLDGVEEVGAAGLPAEYEKAVLHEIDDGEPYGND